MKKIIICSNAYPPNFIGGAELMAHFHAKVLKKMGYDVLIFTGDVEPNGDRHAIRREQYEGLDVYRVHLKPEDYQADFVNFSHRRVDEHFERILESFEPDVVHMHNIIGLSMGIIHLAKRRGIKTVLTLHDHWGFCFKNTILTANEEVCREFGGCHGCMPLIHDGTDRRIPVRMRQDYFALQLEEIDAFISPSHYLADAYIRAGFSREKMNEIWYGVDVDRYEKVAKTVRGGKIRFSFIGYLGRHKGIHTILDALPFLGDYKDFVQINIVGFGDQFDNYKQQVKSIGWADAVHFWGKVGNPDIESVYSETDVLILPSIWPENQPLTIAEAMACRTPVIASRLGGNPELVQHGETGYLFEAGNAEDLAQKMSGFIAEPDRIDIFGENAFQSMKHNTFENSMEKAIRVYNEEASGSNQGRETLIVCVGKNVKPECIRAMESYLQGHSGNRHRFVMVDWIEEDQAREAKLLWVIDWKAKTRDVTIGLRNRIPLLVPEKNAVLKELCVSSNCGLYYHDEYEAEACLEYLIRNKKIASVLGRNGYQSPALQAG